MFSWAAALPGAHNGSGGDWLRGGDGVDVLIAGRGYAALEGGAGNDVLLGGDGENVLYGQEGDDVLDGGGLNTLWGQEGADVFVMSGGHDRIDIRSYDASLGFSGIMSRFTQVGEDAVFNHNGDTLILTGVQVASLTSEDFIF
jgi:Ca2+-binding RTX toxin-like protein